MMNEFHDNKNFPCAVPDGFQTGCGADPTSQIGDMSVAAALACLFALYVVCYLSSWFILFKLSHNHDGQ